MEPTKPHAKNVLGTELKRCGTEPMTGFFRDGCCNTGPGDTGATDTAAGGTAADTASHTGGTGP